MKFIIYNYIIYGNYKLGCGTKIACRKGTRNNYMPCLSLMPHALSTLFTRLLWTLYGGTILCSYQGLFLWRIDTLVWQIGLHHLYKYDLTSGTVTLATFHTHLMNKKKVAVAKNPCRWAWETITLFLGLSPMHKIRVILALSLGSS